ncbi:hypothetical protein HPC49_13280 [Pyxidicoccus fallax]|uniref:Uncharacterized protein n=2 Tax=Pyxidicoccus fallax TaxID=394095 RepID=A0A848LM27_9BACT|nr:hypothetical protein [Pyxidicoccus fallax]NPC79206.1 hypothetical protein [Pyxidicoccus fallax]
MSAIVGKDAQAQGAAFTSLQAAAEAPVPWVYAVWDELLSILRHKDNRARAIAGQLLCHLAKSDSEGRLEKDLEKVLEVTHDEKFVTARHVLLASWRTGVGNTTVRKQLVRALSDRFKSCASEKNGTLVRYDILCALRSLFDETADAKVREAALALIPLEEDPKYRKKYATAWRGA